MGGQNWIPSWDQAVDLEFCIAMKTGSQLPWEIHSRKMIASTVLTPICCTIGVEQCPSVLFGYNPAGLMVAPAVVPSGFQSCPRTLSQSCNSAHRQTLTMSGFEAQQQKAYAGSFMQDLAWPGQEWSVLPHVGEIVPACQAEMSESLVHKCQLMQQFSFHTIGMGSTS